MICSMPFSGSPTINASMQGYGMRLNMVKLMRRWPIMWKLYRTKPTYFEDKLARKEVNFQLQQTQRQEESQWAHLGWDIDFKSVQLQKCHEFEASLVVKEARFKLEVTQRRLAQQVKINEKSQGYLTDHVYRIIEILVKTPTELAILLSTSLVVTRGAVIPTPIPTHHPPLQDQTEPGNQIMKNTHKLHWWAQYKGASINAYGWRTDSRQVGQTPRPHFLKITPQKVMAICCGPTNAWRGGMMCHLNMKRWPSILPKGSSCSSHSLSLMKMMEKIQMKMILMIQLLCQGQRQWWWRRWWWPKLPRNGTQGQRDGRVYWHYTPTPVGLGFILGQRCCKGLL